MNANSVALTIVSRNMAPFETLRTGSQRPRMPVAQVCNLRPQVDQTTNTAFFRWHWYIGELALPALAGDKPPHYS